MKQQSKHSDDARLSALLQVKRAERPNEHRWAQFEYGLAKKRLAVIVDSNTGFFKKLVDLFCSKKLNYALPSVILIVSGILFLKNTPSNPEQYYDHIVQVDASNAQRAYVCDNLVLDKKNSSFASFNFIEKGVGYVCDTVSTNTSIR